MKAYIQFIPARSAIMIESKADILCSESLYSIHHRALRDNDWKQS